MMYLDCVSCGEVIEIELAYVGITEKNKDDWHTGICHHCAYCNTWKVKELRSSK